MLDSQKPSGPWEVDVDLTFAEIAARRRNSPGPPQTIGPSADVFEAEYAHIRAYKIAEPERLSAYLGLTVDAFEKRLHRANS
ncbi:hypothetical protein [Nocardia sp. NPDC004722]